MSGNTVEGPELGPIRQALDAFLSSPDPGVLAIKGDWGAGKTFFVDKYLISKTDLPNQQVSFVSLFGLSSVEEVRRQIIPSALSFRQLRNQDRVLISKKLLGMIRKLPKVSDFETLFQSIENYAIRDLLVVLDDIERKGKELPLKNLLGFVNYLSEHANCKIILILNEDELQKDDKDELGKFREKLIDRELLFAPSYETNARLFFKDTDLFAQALEVFQRCECRNLRVIKRCYVATQEFRTRFRELSPSGLTKLLNQVLLISCLFYRFGGQIDFDALTTQRVIALFSTDTSEKIEGVEILKKVAFRPSDADTLIIKYLRTGFFEPSLNEKLLEADRQMVQQQITWDDIEKTFRLFNANFGSDVEEFTARLEKFFYRNMSVIGWNTFRQGLDALRMLGLDAEADKWTNEFIQLKAPSFSFSECKTFAKLQLSERSQQAITDRRAAILNERRPKKIITKMMEDQGWSEEDTAALDQYDTTYYEEWFKSDQDENLLSLLAEFVRFFNPYGPSDQVGKSIGIKVFSALRNIADGNKFILAKITQVIGISEEQLTNLPGPGSMGVSESQK